MEAQPNIMNIEPTEEGWIVRLHRGTVDEQMAHDIRDYVTQHVEKNASQTLVVDLEGVNYFSSIFLGVLNALRILVEDRDGQFFVTNVSQKIQEIFELTKLNMVINIK